MFITAQKCLGLPVETERGQKLGKVTDFEIDVESHLVQKYHVKSGGLIRGLFEDTLLIDRSEVVSITQEKMTVEDGVYTRVALAKEDRARTILPSAAPAPIQSEMK
ncbi:PRC-barrel domain-containing protein [Candidatus Uhrbacteria bacterium]|nr:PRC-barrel domain-containing protein [Candidatus Uhrbacteria bacterium]